MGAVATGYTAYVEKALELAFGQKKAEAVMAIGSSLPTEPAKSEFFKAILNDLSNVAPDGKVRLSSLSKLAEMKFTPVSPQVFAEDPFYLGLKGEIYPEVMKCFIEINSGKYDEVVLTGAIGTAKTTLALWSTAYQLYLLSAMTSPHKSFGIDRSSEILFVFQSLNKHLAKGVDFARFRSLIERSPYFTQYFPFNKELESTLQFPNRISVMPISGEQTAAIGQNVIGGIIDEINYMQVTQNSKLAIDGGTYDQAVALYNSIARRRKSRFMKGGTMPGLLCLVSSRRYPGQFTDIKEAEARAEIAKYGKTSIYVYDKRTWDIKPPGSFSGNWFPMFIGDDARRPRILSEVEAAKIPAEDQSLIVQIPVEYLIDFERDPMSSLRDIAGVATLAKHPFIVNREAINDCFRDDHNPFNLEAVDFVATRLTIKKSRLFKPHLPRFVHCDLALTGDSAGLVVGTVIGFKKVSVGSQVTEVLPDIWIDAALEIKPPRGGEIQLSKVREVVHALKRQGLNIKWITFDQFQSRDSMQLMKQAGYSVGQQSVDITTAPYDFVKNAIYDGRLSIPRHAKLALELASLEKDVKANKIDHPPHSSKDVSDALAGVVYGLTMRREMWALHGVSLGAIPQSITEGIKKVKVE